MVRFNKHLSKTTVNVNDLNSLIKRQAGRMKKNKKQNKTQLQVACKRFMLQEKATTVKE